MNMPHPVTEFLKEEAYHYPRVKTSVINCIRAAGYWSQFLSSTEEKIMFFRVLRQTLDKLEEGWKSKMKG